MAAEAAEIKARAGVGGRSSSSATWHRRQRFERPKGGDCAARPRI